MFEERSREKTGPVGTEHPEVPPIVNISEEVFFEVAKDSMWEVYGMLKNFAG